jgi:hypothetical protein
MARVGVENHDTGGGQESHYNFLYRLREKKSSKDARMEYCVARR